MTRNVFVTPLIVVGLLVTGTVIGQEEVNTYRTHALTLEDSPKYPPDFEHVEYVNPDAPKGGTLRLFALGGFDTFNIFNIKGDPAVGLLNLFYETLVRETQDDSLTGYGLLAESIEVAQDLSFVIYHLREEARFSDGSPITADDVVFSMNVLKEKGRPFFAHYYANVSKTEALGDHSVKFHFSGSANRELAQIVGQIPILPKAYWEDKEFDQSTLDPPITSGPYEIEDFESGRYVVLKRRDDYWGWNQPLNVGMYNFDRIRYDYVRDDDIAIEAFKSGEYDYRPENNSKKWATSYDFPALNEGLVRKEMLRHYRATGMPSFVFNMRKTKFQDPRVRQAMGLLFNFEWSNNVLFYGQYTRSRSFFENSDLASEGLPSEAELEILEPYRGRIPDEVFTKVFEVPKTDGTQNIRDKLGQANALFKEAGWEVTNGQMVHTESGEKMVVEFLLNTPSFERIIAPFLENLSRLGISGSIRTVEPAQYQNRVREFDFDMITIVFGQSRSPGNEQRDYWGSEAADMNGSRNYAGIKDDVIDELIEKVVGATSREDLKVACKALDRVLQWNYFVIPTWHINSDRAIWWDKFGIPEIKPRFGVGLLSWWVDPEKNKIIEEYRGTH